ncbi:MAG: Na+:solute symporter [Candidatus Sumerlaeaceae bacterium]|nr:Na+:solute symporter [Candidatus Sumerlaeaceae bacterium]
MQLTGLDWSIVVAYFAISLLVGLIFSRRAGKSIQEFFVSARSLPWWIAGTSMVATTFAADTPLAVTGLVVQKGLAGNWLWWSFAVGGMLTVFLYARLWRRAEVLTDVELIELRYGGKPASFLRAFRAAYLAIPINALIIAWVNYAMLNVLKVTLVGENVSDWKLLAIMLAITGFYTMLSGMWGVAITDVLQFVLAMAGCIALAVFAVQNVGGIGALQEKVVAAGEGGTHALDFIPDFSSTAWLTPKMFLSYIFVMWWASWYPGAEPGGGGYVVQRMASCKDERHSLLATLWFQIAHYCLRPWPWILVGLVALVKYPELRTAQDAGIGYPRVMKEVLPAGWRGLLLTAFFAAYMSTLSTQLNWGASYLVNDIYKRFCVRNASDHHYAWISRIATVLILICGAVATQFVESVERAWLLLLALGGGTGAVFLLRWFWWRINAAAEIAAMVAAFVFFILAMWVIPHKGAFTFLDVAEYRTVFIALLTLIVWLCVMYLTAPESPKTLEQFYRKVRPASFGWAPVRRLAPDVRTDDGLFLPSLLCAALGVAVIYTVLPAIGALIFGESVRALILLAVAAACMTALIIILRRIGWQRVVG